MPSPYQVPHECLRSRAAITCDALSRLSMRFSASGSCSISPPAGPAELDSLRACSDAGTASSAHADASKLLTSYVRGGPVTSQLRARQANYPLVTCATGQLPASCVRAAGQLPASYARSGPVTR